MLIQKEDRLSRPTQPARRSDHSRRRAPRNWQKTVRFTLYGLLGLLAGAALLACAALLLDRAAPPPRVAADVAASPAALPVSPAPLAPAPPAAPSLPAQPPPPDSAELSELQARIRAADAKLAQLQAEAEQARQTAAAATQAREAAQADIERQKAAAATAAADDALARREREAAEAEPRRREAPQAHDHAEVVWSDTERRIQALAQPSPAPAAPAAEADDGDGAMTPPLPPGLAREAAAGGARPLVFLHYRGGSRAAQQEATDIAARLLFSDFAYADTRSADTIPPVSTVRYFFPDDAAAAARLAASLAWTGQEFQVQDASGRRHGAAPGTLEVWIGG